MNKPLPILCGAEIYKLVKNGQPGQSFRPTLINPTLGEAEEYGDGCSSEELVATVKRCWAEDPADRPDFHALKTIIKRINKYEQLHTWLRDWPMLTTSVAAIGLTVY